VSVYSPTTEYTALAKIDGGERRIVARDGAGNTRLLVIVRDETEAKRLLPILLDFRGDAAFTDFIDFFPWAGGLVAVFAYHADGVALGSALKDAPYALRAEALRSLFAQILTQNLPTEMLRAVLAPGNLLISPSGKARFLYDLPRETDAEALDDGEIMSDAARRVVGEDTAPEAIAFCEKLKTGLFSDCAAIYTDAYAAADALAAYVSPPKPEKLTSEKAREKIDAFKNALMARWAFILAALALLIGYGAVGALFYNTVIDPPGVDNDIRAIGTVVVVDGP
jgi:hypothetical protein